MAQRGTARHGMARHGKAQCGVSWDAIKHVYNRVHGHVYGQVQRHVYGYVYRYGCRHVRTTAKACDRGLDASSASGKARQDNNAGGAWASLGHSHAIAKVMTEMSTCND